MCIENDLQRFVDEFKIRNKAIIDVLKESLSEKEIGEEIKLIMTKSKKPNSITTMDGSERDLSPFLKERFYFCDKLVDSFEKFHGIDDIKKVLKSKKFISWYESMEVNWENSAPQIFSRSDISILSTINENDGDYCLIVWNNKCDEPEIWRYSGQHEQVFDNLHEYFVWMNEG